MTNRHAAAVVLAGLGLSAAVESAAPQQTRIVFVAGPKDHGRPGRHEYERDLQALKSCLEQASNVKGITGEVLTGQVPDAARLQGAAAIVVESSGDRTPGETHAIFPQVDKTDGKTYDAATMARLNAFDGLMKKGVGLVGIHYSTWVNNETGRKFWLDWLGGVADYGQNDSKVRVTTWNVTPATPGHPVLRGVSPWTYREEYYLDELMPPDPRRTPLLSVAATDDGRGSVVAWAVERAGGGRGVVTTGMDFHENLGNEQHRRFLANAILWAAKVDVPAGGVACAPPSAPSTQNEDRSHYRVLGADNNRIAIVNSKGQVEWEIPNEARANHDIQLLPNGNILFHTGWTTIKEITPDKKIVWQYELTSKPGYTGKFTLHAFERLPNGRTMIAESGNQRIIEVDRNGKIVHEIPLVADKPSATSDTRMVRSVPGGGYLVAHEADRKIREYDRNGKVVWEYALQLNDKPESPGATGHGTMPFGVARLPNGNTLIGGGNNNRVIEVNKAGQIVWSVEAKDLPGISLAWVTTVDPLPNGNVIFGNSHAGPDNPQLIEVTRDKKVVWTFKNFEVFGNNLVAAKVIRDRK